MLSFVSLELRPLSVRSSEPQATTLDNRKADILVEQFRPGVMDRLGLGYWKSAANFVLIRLERASPRDVFRRLLDEHGILVRDVSSGAELSQCLRISVGTEDDVDAVADALGAILAP